MKPPLPSPYWSIMSIILLLLLLLLSAISSVASAAAAVGVNYGAQSSHPLPPSMLVQLMTDNMIGKVKLFDSDDDTLNALKDSKIEVMLGIPNDELSSLASDGNDAEKWVSDHVSGYVNNGVDIRHVAVGNEPFLEAFGGTYLETTLPAMQNVQLALNKAGFGDKVKVTCPLNADVYYSPSNKPSDGDFRTDIHDHILALVRFLYDNGSPFTVNIYPFIALYSDPNFPMDFAFFEGTTAPLVDGSVSYTNMFDANHDTLVWALKKNGFNNLPIIIGEIGWPTDGDLNANVQNAARFNKGFLSHVARGQGTPMRPGPIQAYLFSLIDEDQKSTKPGNFERHWGIFSFDGYPKYQLNLGPKTGIQRARGLEHLEKQWCVLKPDVKPNNPMLAASVSYACANADCTSLGYRTSCGGLDTLGNASYAFNSYYQKEDQDDRACDFSGLATITKEDPSSQTCKFIVMIDISAGRRRGGASVVAEVVLFMMLVLLLSTS